MGHQNTIGTAIQNRQDLGWSSTFYAHKTSQARSLARQNDVIRTFPAYRGVFFIDNDKIKPEMPEDFGGHRMSNFQEASGQVLTRKKPLAQATR